jgi:3-oxoacyl-[acyl-carrier protein] reductase
MKLDNKVALVTGASRGIGRAIALRLAKDGALVIVHYAKNEQAASGVVKEIEQAGGKAFALQAEFESLQDIEDLFKNLDKELTQRTGESHFDILVNNASITDSISIEDETEDRFDHIFTVNVKGPFFVIKHALSRIRDGGRIINVSSCATRCAFPDYLAYTMTKGAINSLTYVLAQDLGKRGITVNAIAPGVTDTDMNANWLNEESKKSIQSITALGRIGKAEDIADVAAFLASNDSHWVTAQYIEASGGIRL